MMFNSCTHGGYSSQNLEDFDSIHSVLLYRSVALFHRLNLKCLRGCAAVSARGRLNTGGDLKTSCSLCRIRTNELVKKSYEKMCACKIKSEEKLMVSERKMRGGVKLLRSIFHT